MRLLIVEDDPELILLLEHFLNEFPDVEYTICDSTDVAKDKVAEGFAPDAALIDFSSKGRATSVDLGRIIIEKVPNCKLHLMSGIGAQLMKTATRDIVDVAGYIEKPFSVQKVIETITGMNASEDGRPSLRVTQYPQATTGQMEMLKKLLQEDPSDVATRQLLAFSLYTAGRYRDALKEYETVAKDGIETFLCAYYHGHTLARLHLFKDAIKIWEKAIELAPHNGAAAKVQARISQAQEMHRMERKLRDTDPGRKPPKPPPDGK